MVSDNWDAVNVLPPSVYVEERKWEKGERKRRSKNKWGQQTFLHDIIF